MQIFCSASSKSFSFPFWNISAEQDINGSIKSCNLMGVNQLIQVWPKHQSLRSNFMVMMLVICKGVAIEGLKSVFTIYNVMLCCILKTCLLIFHFYSLCGYLFIFLRNVLQLLMTILIHSGWNSRYISVCYLHFYLLSLETASRGC